ncbi:hypothetical protein KC345_g6741 [Hortaea werneckii]|nr:hypothetical protein KC345_g6741 [Hortaea werneckii]
MGSTRSKSSRAAPANTCLPAADRQQTPPVGVCALLRLFWQTKSQAVSGPDASLGFCPGDSWADYGSVRLRGSGETVNLVSSLSFSRNLINPPWSYKGSNRNEFASNVDASNAKEKTSFHDGQAMLAVNYDGNTAYFDPNKACDAARVTAEKAGELRAFTEIPSRYPSLEFRVEYDAISDTKKLIKSATEEGPAIRV